jgi:GNAT superfamily N-acetyltransferase
MPLVRVSDVFELRPLSYDHPDAEVLTERAQEYYVDIYGGRDEDPLAAAELTPPHGGFVLGYLDGEPVAMGGWVLVDGPESTRAYGARVAQIRRMYVDAGLRRRGLATAVLAHLETDAARFGVTMIILATGQPQVEAISLYRRHGYRDIAPFGYYAGGDLVVCLGKDLSLEASRPDRPADQPTS